MTTQFHFIPLLNEMKKSAAVQIHIVFDSPLFYHACTYIACMHLYRI